MPFFKVDDLQLWTGGRWINIDPERKPEIRGFSNDSRNMEKDFAFVAIKAERDGHDFAADAAANGATAVIAERELDINIPTLIVENSLKAFQRIAKMHRLRFENPVVGITGSCGKTSTKEMIARLAAWKPPLVTQKNFNNEIGVPLTLTRMDLRQNQAAVIEAGVGAPGQMFELASMIEPDIAVITNVGPSHLERFEQVSNIAKEKAVLAENVAEGGWCLIHHNLLSWKAFDELKCKKAVLAPVEAPDFKADLIFRYATSENDDGNTAIDMCIEGGNEYYFEMPAMSRGMTENALLAIAAALMLGGREEYIARKLEELSPLPMRGNTVEMESCKYYIDCYNASPASMRDSLGRFSKMAGEFGKRAYVLGTMAELGLSAHPYHRDVGLHLEPRADDTAILVGAFAEAYKSGLLENGWDEKNIFIFDTAEEAKQKVGECSGFVFVKGSRICSLEKSLPDEVAEKLAEDSGKWQSEGEESSPEENSGDIETGEAETASEESECEDDFEDDSEFEGESLRNDDDEDEREKI